MPDAKSPRVLFLIAILALAGALLVAGCGGGGSSSSSGATAPAAGEETEGGIETESGGAGGGGEEALDEKEEEGEAIEEGGEAEAGGEEGGTGGAAAGGAAMAEGKTVFTANCASCHTLKEAGASGEVGPNLDELEPDMGTVEHQVINGGGGMPAFKGTLSGGEIKAVATYVSSVAGTE
jgi:cytochrome c5